MNSVEVESLKHRRRQRMDRWIISLYTTFAMSYFAGANPRHLEAPVLKLTGRTVRCLGLGGVVVRENKSVLVVHLTNAPRPTLFGRSECVVVK